MGLFDNLFLDANTPVTINDGVDHSKDVVTPIIDPKPESIKGEDGTGVKGDSQDDKTAQKDGALTELFGADKKEEEAAEKILSSEPPPDIALSIGLGPVSDTTQSSSEIPTPAVGTPDASDAALSFDIGGDISFDIGGDMVLGGDVSVLASSTDTPEINVISSSLLDANTVNMTTSESSSLPEQSNDISPDIGNMPIDVSNTIESSPQPIGDINHQTIAIDNLSAPLDTSIVGENALFSLLNTETTVENLEASASSENKEADSSDLTGVSVVSAAPNDSLMSIITESPDTEQHAPTSDIAPDMLESVHIDTAPPTLLPSTPAIESIYAEQSMMPVSSVSKPKLRQKLSEFLHDLESLEIGDDATKAHKMHQISMCKARISEIEADSKARISEIEAESRVRIMALNAEISMLKNEIDDMHKEKTHLKNVIKTFQKELETV